MESEKSYNKGSPTTPTQNSWFNPEWKTKVDKTNIMDYFQQPENPFYDINCNNEILKRKNPQEQQLKEMIGIEYVTYQLAEPTCFVVRKQFRHGPIRITRLSDYHIVNGMIYETSDLQKFVNVKLKSFVRKIQSSCDESVNRVRFDTSTENSWNFDSNPEAQQATDIEQRRVDKPSTSFQRERVETQLDEVNQEFSLSYKPYNLQNTENTSETTDQKRKCDTPMNQSDITSPENNRVEDRELI